MNQFEALNRQKDVPLIKEFAAFILENKKWWMLPIVVMLGLVGLLVLIAGTGAAPFIYTLF